MQILGIFQYRKICIHDLNKIIGSINLRYATVLATLSSARQFSITQAKKVMTNPFMKHTNPGYFRVLRPISTSEILSMARHILKRQLFRGPVISAPRMVKELLMMELALLEQEVFYCIFLDSQYRILTAERCISGPCDEGYDYAREIVKRALQVNAKAVITAQNKVSGSIEPSFENKTIIRRLICALSFVEIKLLEHFIITGIEHFSFADHNLL